MGKLISAFLALVAFVSAVGFIIIGFLAFCYFLAMIITPLSFFNACIIVASVCAVFAVIYALVCIDG